MRLTRLFAVILLVAGAALAGTIPLGYSCTGNCGTGTPNGVVTTPPNGATSYLYVSTELGPTGGGTVPTGALGAETNGSTLRSGWFNAAAGDHLQFYFNYVTSDGTPTYPDYAWAALLNLHGNPAELIFTARTIAYPDNIVPGFGMPALSVHTTLTPAAVPILTNPVNTPPDGGPAWAELGGSSGWCWQGIGQGCGYTDWIQSTYVVQNTGVYRLAFGTTNWNDQAYDSGMAISGATIHGVPIDDDRVEAVVPEPSTFALFGLGAAVVAFARRRAR